jgi:hypothetical protein
MDIARRPVLPPAIDDLHRRLIQWRSDRSKKGPIPEELWLEAARLARVHGISRVAVALGLGFKGLKERTEGATEPPAVTKGPSFVEIDPRSMSLVSGTSVEVERPDGTKMTIRLSGAVPLDLATLVDSFLGKRG